MNIDGEVQADVERSTIELAELDAVARAEAYAQGINATPTVVVNGVPLDSPDFQSIADAIVIELAKVQTASADTAEEPEEVEEE